MNAGALRIPVPVAVDGRQRAADICKRIIGRDGAIVVDAVDLSVGIVKFLRKIEVLSPVADTEKQLPLAVEGQFATEVMRAVGIGGSPEEYLLICQSVAFQPGPHNGCIAEGFPFFGILGAVGDVNPAILLIIRMQANVEQSALSFRPDGWQAFDGRGKFSV